MCIVDALGAAVVGVTLGVLGVAGAHVTRSGKNGLVLFFRRIITWSHSTKDNKLSHKMDKKNVKSYFGQVSN